MPRSEFEQGTRAVLGKLVLRKLSKEISECYRLAEQARAWAEEAADPRTRRDLLLVGASMTQIVDLMLDGKRYKVVFPHDAPPRAYLMIRRRQNDPHFMSVREPERYDRVVEAARRTLTDPATQNIPTEKSATQ